MEQTPKSANRRRRAKWSIGAAAGTAAALALAWLVDYGWCSWSRETALASLRERGEPVWWEEHCAAEKPFPEPNGAASVKEAIAALGELKSWGAATIALPGVDWSTLIPSTSPELATFAASLRPAIAALEKATKLPPGRMVPLIGFDGPAYYAESTRVYRGGLSLFEALRIDASAALGRKDVSSALKSAGLALGLADQLRNEQYALSESLCMSFARDALAAALACGSPSVEDAAALDELFAAAEKRSTRETLRRERAWTLSAFERPDLIARAREESFGGMITFRTPPSGWSLESLRFWTEQRWSQGEKRIDIWMLRNGLKRPTLLSQQAKLVRYYDRLLELCDEPSPPPQETLVSLNRLSGNNALDPYAFASRAFWEAFDARETAAIARLALRVARFKARTGKHPERLEEAARELNGATSFERWGGKPPAYARRGEGFAIAANEWDLDPRRRSLPPVAFETPPRKR